MSFVLENKTQSIAVGTSSGELLPARATREHLFLRNDSANTIHIRFGDTAAVADATSIKLVSGAELTVETPGTAAIQAIALVATSNLTVSETLLFTPLPSEPILQMNLTEDLSLTKGNGPATFTRSTTATFLDVQTGLVKTAAIDTPRFEANGLLIEGASTNGFLRSEEFDNASWVKSGVTVTANADTAPDGNATADQLVFTDATSTCNQDVTATTSASEERTATFYVKDTSGSGSIRIEFEDNISGVQTSGDLTINSLGYTRIEFTATFGAASISREIRLRGNSAGTTGTVQVWGAQQELFPFASSYIPTTTATVTRTAEDLDIPFTGNIPAPTDEYTWGATIDTLGLTTTPEQSFLSIVGESFRVLKGSSNVSKPKVFHGANGVDDFVEGVVLTDTDKVFAVFDGTQIELFQEGVSQGTKIPSGPVTGTGTAIDIGSRNSSQYLFGHIRDLKIFAKALSPSRIKKL